ncbi:MAG: hypothetical protein ACI959_000823 [Limisphaerales bacterium]|jgi:hypothetical protein
MGASQYRNQQYRRKIAALKMTLLMFTMITILIWAAATAYAQAPIELPAYPAEDLIEDQTEVYNESVSQEATSKLLIEGDFSAMTTDGIGGIYTVSAGEEIKLYGRDGVLKYRYSNNRLGQIGNVDASNSLSVLVYYPEYATVVLLNNTLSEYGRLDLRQLNLFGVQAAGLARDGNIWVYDPYAFQMVKIDKKGSVIKKTEPLNYVLNVSLNPTRIIERNRRVFLHDPGYGILVFDEFGTFDFPIVNKQIKNFQVIKDQLVCMADAEKDKTQNWIFNLVSLTEQPLNIIGDKLRIEGEAVYSLQKKGVFTFSSN